MASRIIIPRIHDPPRNPTGNPGSPRPISSLNRPEVAVVEMSDCVVLVKPPRLSSGAGFEVMVTLGIPPSYWDPYADKIAAGLVSPQTYTCVDATYVVWQLSETLFAIAWLDTLSRKGSAGELVSSYPTTDRPHQAIKLEKR